MFVDPDGKRYRDKVAYHEEQAERWGRKLDRAIVDGADEYALDLLDSVAQAHVRAALSEELR